MRSAIVTIPYPYDSAARLHTLYAIIRYLAIYISTSASYIEIIAGVVWLLLAAINFM